MESILPRINFTAIGINAVILRSLYLIIIRNMYPSAFILLLIDYTIAMRNER